MDVMEIKSFFDVYSKEIIGELDYKDFMSGGSRLFGDNTDDSDWDVYVLVKNLTKTIEKLTEEGYSNCGEDYEIDDESTIYIARKGPVNLIITNCGDQYDLWGRCNRVASILRLNKNDRAVMFDIINN